MPKAVRRLAAVGVAVGLAATATACSIGPEHRSVAPLAQISVSNAAAQNGIAELEPATALKKTIAAMEATGSYRVSGTTTSGKAIDITFDVGVGSVGTINTGNPMQILAADGSVFVSGDADSMSALVGADADETIAGKWIHITPDSESGFDIFADGATFAQAVLGAGAPSEMTGVAEVDGRLAVGLLFPETGATLWVAAIGEPLPLRFEEKGASAGKGILTFTDFGEPVEIQPPAEDELLDVEDLPAE